MSFCTRVGNYISSYFNNPNELREFHPQPGKEGILNNDCGVCLQPLNSIPEGFTPLQATPMAHPGDGQLHPYHKNCIEPWVVQKGTCPACNANLRTAAINFFEKIKEPYRFYHEFLTVDAPRIFFTREGLLKEGLPVLVMGFMWSSVFYYGGTLFPSPPPLPCLNDEPLSSLFGPN